MNKKQQTELCRNILYSYSVNSIIDKEKDIVFLLSIFENHSEWNLKNGVGLKSISVVKNIFNKCFQLNRIDGSYTDISFTHCISNPSKISEVKKACRSAIRGEIVNYRNDNVIFGITKCVITNEVLTKENTHIDHYNLSFNEVVNNWMLMYKVEDLINSLNSTLDNCVTTFFTNDKLINDFIIFHNNNTNLRAITKEVNLSMFKFK